MKASIIDLRYHMKEILQSLERNEVIQILYHGVIKGTLLPARSAQKQKIEDHPLFGINKNNTTSVEEQLNSLRKSRY